MSTMVMRHLFLYKFWKRSKWITIKDKTEERVKIWDEEVPLSIHEIYLLIEFRPAFFLIKLLILNQKMRHYA